ncbi:MAG TPA: PEP/pyruvate-binding domain-containing protein [Polyangiaceae bacterium]|nr:PEP/pyruvate-binding domain-containing protein [Polyangiaceae bacterium]
MTLRTLLSPGYSLSNQRRPLIWLTLFVAVAACGDIDPKPEPDEGAAGASGARPVGVQEGECLFDPDEEAPDFAQQITCKANFDALASAPLDASLPGSISAKVVLDRYDESALYFQNSTRFPIHYEFVSEHLSGGALPIVPELMTFEATEYYRPDRRFVLGAVSYYEAPDVWALELSPYDTASAEMIQALYEATAQSAYFGPALKFHPTSEPIEKVAEVLPESVQVITGDELYEKIDYQPLTLGTTIGRIHFARRAELAEVYLGYQAIAVLDEVPNDIAVVAGLITQQFQTPLSHVNVLSQNRHTPNMGLRGAFDHETLRGLEGKWVELTVGATDWSVREATAEEAEEFWADHKPTPVVLADLNLDVTELLDIEDVTPEVDGVSLRDAITESVRAWGGKAAQYSILAKTAEVPTPKAFAIPVFYYHQFMTENGFFERVDALLADADFMADPALRELELQTLRDDMVAAPVNQDFQTLLQAKLEADYPGITMRFRTSTNSEDLDGFPCAGCYESQTGDPADWETVLTAVKGAWSSIWLFRTFEERSYYGIDHQSVAMALLVHHNFPAEEANGVATTNNPFDVVGIEPAFYVNVQWGGDAEVVHPPPGVTSDSFLYFFDNPNQPITFIAHSNLVPEGESVLNLSQTHELGVALKAIHARFSPAYGPKSGNQDWYAMDVEFKFDDMNQADGKPHLYIKQARPYPGRSAAQ